MYIELFLMIFLFIIYFLFYIEIKVNKSNIIYNFDKELTRHNLNSETFLKLPFYFNGSHINKECKKSSLIKIEKKKNYYEKYKSLNNQYYLLEPRIQFTQKQEIFYVHKNKFLPLLCYSTSINYCIIKKGSFKLTLIHPKYRENFIENNNLCNSETKYNYIKNNNLFQSVICYENTIIYFPDQWIIYIENNENKTSILEIIEYSTLCNQFIGYIKNNLINKK